MTSLHLDCHWLRKRPAFLVSGPHPCPGQHDTTGQSSGKEKIMSRCPPSYRRHHLSLLRRGRTVFQDGSSGGRDGRRSHNFAMLAVFTRPHADFPPHPRLASKKRLSHVEPTALGFDHSAPWRRRSSRLVGLALALAIALETHLQQAM
jgi:hypothetical protein